MQVIEETKSQEHLLGKSDQKVYI